MSLVEAFEHFLQNIAGSHYTKGTVASWKNRFNSNKLTYEKMNAILNKHGYKCTRSEEVWLAPGEKSSYEFIICEIGTKKPKLECITISAPNKAKAMEIVDQQYDNYRSVLVSGLSTAAKVKLINAIL